MHLAVVVLALGDAAFSVEFADYPVMLDVPLVSSSLARAIMLIPPGKLILFVIQIEEIDCFKWNFVLKKGLLERGLQGVRDLSLSSGNLRDLLI